VISPSTGKTRGTWRGNKGAILKNRKRRIFEPISQVEKKGRERGPWRQANQRTIGEGEKNEKKKPLWPRPNKGKNKTEKMGTHNPKKTTQTKKKNRAKGGRRLKTLFGERKPEGKAKHLLTIRKEEHLGNEKR